LKFDLRLVIDVKRGTEFGCSGEEGLAGKHMG
jgi:hypothetical protein